MEIKNNKHKRTFIPQKIGDTVKKINRNFTSKFGKIEFIIHSNWPKIVGSYFSEYSVPKEISRQPNYESKLGEKIFKNYLNVSVAPAAALEFQHFKDKVIENINSYFGYKAIVDLRIDQNYISYENSSLNSNNNVVVLSETEKKNIKSELENMKNNDLKKSLINLGITITKETK